MRCIGKGAQQDCEGQAVHYNWCAFTFFGEVQSVRWNWIRVTENEPTATRTFYLIALLGALFEFFFLICDLDPSPNKKGGDRAKKHTQN